MLNKSLLKLLIFIVPFKKLFMGANDYDTKLQTDTVIPLISRKIKNNNFYSDRDYNFWKTSTNFLKFPKLEFVFGEFLLYFLNQIDGFVQPIFINTFMIFWIRRYHLYYVTTNFVFVIINVLKLLYWRNLSNGVLQTNKTSLTSYVMNDV